MSAFGGNTSNYAPGVSTGNKKEEDSRYGGDTSTSAPGADSPRMAGKELYRINNIKNFDLDASGAGAGKRDKLSRQDIKRLRRRWI